MKPFRQYRRTAVAEMRPYEPGEEMIAKIPFDEGSNIQGHPIEKFKRVRISISQPDIDAGSPKLGDMIARNPENHEDQWLVAKAYFEANFSPMKIDEQTSSRVSSIAADYIRLTGDKLKSLVEADAEATANDIQTIAASALTQDKTPGQDVASGTVVDVGEDDAVVEAREIGGHDIDRDGPVKFDQ